MPTGQAISCISVIRPPSFFTFNPVSLAAVRVVIVIRDTAAILARASPRKPRVAMASRSCSLLILLVACRSNAMRISLSSIPLPLSATRMLVSPPSWISTVTAVAPASRLFSISSLIAAAGLSTTSPAAILPIRFSLSGLIFPIVFSFSNCLFLKADYSLRAFSRSRNSVFIASIGVIAITSIS